MRKLTQLVLLASLMVAGPAFADMKMDIKDYSTYTYDLGNSWPTLVTTKRTTVMEMLGDSGTNVEETIIERVY